MPTLPSLSLSDRESLAGRSKNSPIEKAVCDWRHIIIKKLCHRVITFTHLTASNQSSLRLLRAGIAGALSLDRLLHEKSRHPRSFNPHAVHRIPAPTPAAYHR